MASPIIYSYFIKDVYDNLPINRKVFLRNEKDNLRTYAQSTEPLKLYRSFNRKKEKKINSIAKTFHTKKTSEFLITLINYIKLNDLYNNPAVMGCLYSFVSHYIIDTNLNPYIYYNTGGFKSRSINNINLFNLFKKNIEEYLIIQNEKQNPKKYKHYNIIFKKIYPSKKLEEVLNFTFKEVYKINHFTNTWISSIKKSRKIYKHKRYDPFSIKIKFYHFYDKTLNRKKQKTEYLSYASKINNSDFLNQNKQIWYFPTTKNKKSKRSFIEIYSISVKECINLINIIDKYIYTKSKIKIDKYIQNKSYITGVDIKVNQTMKYYKN